MGNGASCAAKMGGSENKSVFSCVHLRWGGRRVAAAAGPCRGEEQLQGFHGHGGSGARPTGSTSLLCRSTGALLGQLSAEAAGPDLELPELRIAMESLGGSSRALRTVFLLLNREILTTQCRNKKKKKASKQSRPPALFFSALLFVTKPLVHFSS